MNFRKLFLISLAFTASTLAISQVPAVKNTAFAGGEHLKYDINFYSLITGSVKAGEFELTVDREKTTLHNHQAYHCIARGHTTWAFDFFYKVNDRFESYIDDSTLLPLLALRRIQETDFFRDEDLYFDRINQQAKYKNNIKGVSKVIPTAVSTMDILSAVYFLRLVKIPAQDLNADIQISYIFADSLRSSTIRFLGTETLKTSAGMVHCIKVKPQVLKGSVFRTNYPLTIWISNDSNRIPVLVESEIVMGKVRVELVSWSGLLNPFAALKTVKK